MQLNTGVTPTLSILVDTLAKCTGWHICVTDLGKNDPGIKAVMLIDDTEGVYFDRVGAKFKNTVFDGTSLDFADGELHPHWHSPNQYCFDVNVQNLSASANAPLAIIDNGGNATIINLQRSAPSLSLSTIPPTSHPDSIYFPHQKIGTQICTTFVFKNTGAAGSLPINIVSAGLKNSDSVFQVQSITPALPYLLPPQSSVTLQLCYTAKDELPHYDSLILSTDCFAIPISLGAYSATGLIIAGDLDFGSVKVGDELCKDLQIKNTGSLPFTLTKGWKLFDQVNFAMNQTFLATLPLVIQPGQIILVNICFHPKTVASDSSGIDWGTNIDGSFAGLMKSHSILRGNGIPSSSVKTSHLPDVFSLRPNPVSGNSVMAYFSGAVETRGTLTIGDVLGREVYRKDIIQGISQLEIPLRNLSVGIYYARFFSDLGMLTQKLEIIK
jgi:hypothetical protein